MANESEQGRKNIGKALDVIERMIGVNERRVAKDDHEKEFKAVTKQSLEMAMVYMAWEMMGTPATNEPPFYFTRCMGGVDNTVAYIRYDSDDDDALPKVFNHKNECLNDKLGDSPLGSEMRLMKNMLVHGSAIRISKTQALAVCRDYDDETKNEEADTHH